MNHFKLQQEIMKYAHKRDTTHKYTANWLWSRIKMGVSDFVMVVTDVRGYFVPAEQWYLDCERVFEHGENNLKAIADGANNYTVPLKDSGLRRKLQKITVAVLEGIDTDMEVWVDVKNLDLFDLSVATFKGTNEKSPVFVYEYDMLVGLVLPVKQTKEE